MLTDAEFFGGSPDDLKAASAVTRLPVLRKDFTVDGRDVADARLMGADCVLLIVAALSRRRPAAGSTTLAARLGLAALVEVHDEAELERSPSARARHHRRQPARPASRSRSIPAGPPAWPRSIPDGVVKIAESGIHDADDRSTPWPTPATTPSWWGSSW